MTRPLLFPASATLVALALFAPACTSKKQSSTGGDARSSASPPPSPAADQEEPAGEAGERTAMVAADHALYARVEGTGFDNSCANDDDCEVGGCSSEVCAAEAVTSSCEAIDNPAAGGSCGCVAGECIWYVVEGASGPSGGPSQLAAEVQRFADRACACKDADCAGAVEEQFISWVADRTDMRADDAERAQVEKEKERLRGCLEKLEEALPGVSQKCTASGQCRPGLTCIKYYGIAGPRGPEFSSCEIRCGKGGSCPEGMGCVTIADGPGQVCR